MDIEAAQIIGLYQRHADAWARDRGTALVERAWLDRFAALLPLAPAILDLGCGSGEPIAGYFMAQGCCVTGVDSAPRMIAMCSAKFPKGTWIVGDMREVSLGQAFHGILAWDSFFHLCPDDQRRMFDVFRTHVAPDGVLMFTSGTSHGVAMGSYNGEALYHASLASAEYCSLLNAHGFDIVAHAREDPACGGRTVWLAQH